MKRIVAIVMWGFIFACVPIVILLMTASIMSFQRGDPTAETLTVMSEVSAPALGLLGLVFGFRGKLPGTKTP